VRVHIVLVFCLVTLLFCVYGRAASIARSFYNTYGFWTRFVLGKSSSLLITYWAIWQGCLWRIRVSASNSSLQYSRQLCGAVCSLPLDTNPRKVTSGRHSWTRSKWIGPCTDDSFWETKLLGFVSFAQLDKVRSFSLTSQSVPGTILSCCILCRWHGWDDLSRNCSSD
jgi:hypothetical protein